MDFKSDFMYSRKLKTYKLLQKENNFINDYRKRNSDLRRKKHKKSLKVRLRAGKNTLVVCCDGLILVLLYLVNLLHGVISIST